MASECIKNRFQCVTNSPISRVFETGGRLKTLLGPSTEQRQPQAGGGIADQPAIGRAGDVEGGQAAPLFVPDIFSPCVFASRRILT
jgi:hypothetical protein